MESEKRKWKNIEYHMNYKEGKSFSLFQESFPDVREWFVVDADAYHLSPARDVACEIREVGHVAHVRTPEEIFRLAEKNPETLYLVFGSLYMLTPFLQQI
jgi:folylpolyglutamate synthase/dihydropteroate synthase